MARFITNRTIFCRGSLCYCGTISAIGLNTNTSISDNNVMNMMNVLTNSECCFCLISVARNVTSTPPVNTISTLQNLGMEMSHQMFQTQARSYCTQSTRNQTTKVRTAFRVRGQTTDFALLSECAGQTTDFAGQTTDFALLSECAVQTRSVALLRVRGDGQHNTMREVTLDEAHVRGITSTPQCAM